MRNLFQYQALAEPILVPAAPETITVDKWFRPTSVPVLPPRRPNLGFSVGPLVTSFGEVILPDKWYRPLSNPVLPKARPSLGFTVKPLEPSLFVVPSMDSWYQQPSEPMRRKKFVLHNWMTVSPFQVITVDQWFMPLATPVLPKKRPLLGFTVGPLVTSFGEVIFVDKWFRPLETPTLPKVRVRPGYFTEPLEPSLFITPSMDSWYRQASEPIRIAPLARTGVSVVSPFQIITVDQWFSEQPIFRPQAKRSPGETIEPLAEPIVASSMAWMGQESHPVARQDIRIAESTVRPIQFDAEAVLLSWLVQQPVPVRTIARAFAETVLPPIITDAPAITVDMWFSPSPQPMLRRWPTQQQNPFVPIIITPTVEVPCPYRPGTSEEPDGTYAQMDFGFAYSGSVEDTDSRSTRGDEGADETYKVTEEDDQQPKRRDECT